MHILNSDFISIPSKSFTTVSVLSSMFLPRVAILFHFYLKIKLSPISSPSIDALWLFTY